MHRIFVPLYDWFAGHKSVMYTLLVVSSVIFVYFGLKVSYEEDISKLLPSSASSNSELAFGSLKVKDKIFVQLVSRDSLLDTYTLSEYADEFVEALWAEDSVNAYVADVLYRIPDDMGVNAVDYAMTHVPSFVDVGCYVGFDSLMTQAAADAMLAADYEMVMADETGSLTQMVSTDPLGLRNVLASSLFGSVPFGNLQGGNEDAGECDEDGFGDDDGSPASPLSGLGGYAMVDGCLFCADKSVALAFISPNFNSLDSKSGTRLIEEIEAAAVTVEKAHPDVKILFHGSPVRSVFNSRQIKKDLFGTVGISLLLILLVLGLCFKSFNIIPLNLMPVLYGTFFALSCMYWIKGGMSLMALGIGAIVLGVALSYCLHVIVHFKFVGNARKMLEDESTPVCMGCITTIGAFIGLLFTESDLLRDFGIFASLSLVGNTLFALVFLPHFLKSDRKNERAFALIDRMNNYPYDRKPVLLALMGMVIVIGLVFAHKVEFDCELRNIGYNEPSVLESEKLFADKNYDGQAQRYYAVASASLDEALELNSAVMSTMDSLAAQGLVMKYSAVVPMLFQSENLQNERIAAWKEYWSAERISDVRHLLAASSAKHGLREDMFEPFYAMVGSDYEPGSLYDAGVIPDGLLANFIEKSAAEEAVDPQDETVAERYLVFTSAQMLPENQAVVDAAVAANPSAIVIDPFFYTNDMVRVIHDDFNLTLGISSLFVFLVLLLSYRKLWVALVAFMPMFFSWYVVQGLMAIFGVEFNLINIVISTFIFGIGVDYSIFVMDGLLCKARGGDDRILSYHKSAIFFSALVLVVVVTALLFARHPALSSIGVSTIIGMLSTILITYTLQPFLFRLLLKLPFVKC